MSEHEHPVPRSGDDTDPVPDAANLGPVRPPLVYLGSILLGLLLHFAWPLPLVQQPVGALIGAGVVFLAGGLLITLVPALALMSLWVIPREERYLEARFSSEYLSYKSSVRRWL